MEIDGVGLLDVWTEFWVFTDELVKMTGTH